MSSAILCKSVQIFATREKKSKNPVQVCSNLFMCLFTHNPRNYLFNTIVLQVLHSHFLQYFDFENFLYEHSSCGL